MSKVPFPIRHPAKDGTGGNSSYFELIVANYANWRQICVDIGSGSDMLPNPMLTSHLLSYVTFTWEQYHSECPYHYSG